MHAVEVEADTGEAHRPRRRRFAEGEGAYRRALAILQKTYGPDDPRLADIYHNLGGLAHARGRYEEGEPLARRGLEMRERALGPDDRDVAADVAALAAILDGEAKRDEAERLYLRALDVFEREAGPDSYDVAVNLNNLGALYQAEGKAGEARPRSPGSGNDAQQPRAAPQVSGSAGRGRSALPPRALDLRARARSVPPKRRRLPRESRAITQGPARRTRPPE